MTATHGTPSTGDGLRASAPSAPASPLEPLCARFAAGDAVVAGVLSGTSGDGIDVALVRMGLDPARAGEPVILESIAFDTLDFPVELGKRVRSALDGAPLGLRESALLTRDLGWAFGAAARALALREGRPLDLVGSHGQTVYHHDGRETSGPATLQLGDGDFVAEAARAAVVSDFRSRDIAAGGEGAPISALADDLLFAHAPRPCGILNLGGMGNLTILRDDPATLSSFDTGPANALLDGLARRLYGAPYDKNGARALTGRARPELVDELMRHPFFDLRPPRSTGRDTFGEAWVDGVVERARTHRGLRQEDLLATANTFVARTVQVALERFVPDPLAVLCVAGGGIHNRALCAALATETRAELVASDDLGVPADAREGLVFAILAARCVLGRPVTRTTATGARAGRMLGKISLSALGTAR
ncbi:MAG: anhydro-N-acetylmuramic acid kinase [Planctomycetota bacterium]